MKYKVRHESTNIDHHKNLIVCIAAVLMARESNTNTIQTLKQELDGYLQQVRQDTDQDAQLNATIASLQCVFND
jgi:hypothetical protein